MDGSHRRDMDTQKKDKHKENPAQLTLAKHPEVEDKGAWPETKENQSDNKNYIAELIL